MEGDSSYHESKEDEYEWFESLKRDLDIIHRWKQQFFGGRYDENDN